MLYLLRVKMGIVKLFIFLSMNFITASLLIVCKDEEDSFWSLALLEERILKEYHSRHMLGCRTDCRFLMELTKTYLPKAHAVFEEKQVIPEVAFIHWFLCIFVNSLPFGTAMRVWDKLMADMKDSNTMNKPLDVVFTIFKLNKVGAASSPFTSIAFSRLL